MGKPGNRRLRGILKPSSSCSAKNAKRAGRPTVGAKRVKHKECGGKLSPIERVVRLRWCETCCVEIGVEGWKCVD